MVDGACSVLWFRRCHHFEGIHGFTAAAEFAGELCALHAREARGKTAEALPELDRIGIAAPAADAPHIRNAVENARLGSFAKTFNRRDAVLARGALERIERVDAKLFKQETDPRGSELRHCQQLEQPV